MLFLVCDGVGGANKGEVASSLICDHFPSHFNNSKTEIIHDRINDSIAYVKKQLIEYVSANTECQGMASTFTMLFINKDKCYVSWIGDSRIYHIRDGKIIFKSKDHL